jgi:hypothetical protein
MKELYEAVYPLVKDPKKKDALIEPYAKLLFEEFYWRCGIHRKWSEHKTEWIQKAKVKLNSL